MKTTHTPGPWTYSPAVACVFAEKDRSHCPQICSLPAFAPQNTENGHLIAAAPELLTMLRRVMDEYLMRDPSNGPVSQLTLEHARAAIAKAEGNA